MTIRDAVTELSEILGERLSLSKSDRDIHGRSETYFADAAPDAVAYPATTADVARIARLCNEHDCPVIPWGTGTSLEGHSLATRGGVTVDFSRMNKVLSIDAEDMTATIQPGLTRMELNTELRATGLFFPVDPGANAALGGMAATRASGTTAVRYGTMASNVLALEVVLADGRIIRTGSKAPKSSAGYDLTHLFVGSEGTLGLITELTLKLQGVPEEISSGICAFETIDSAVQAVIQTIQMGIPVARIELLDADCVAAFNAYAGAQMPVAPHLMVEFHGSQSAVAEQAERFGSIAADMGGSGFTWSTQEEERRKLWQMRHDGYYAILALRKGATALTTDICVPISKLAQAIDETRADIAKASIPGPILGHVGDGNFHAALLVEPGNAAELAEAKALSDRMVTRALELGGTITGEHGVGIGKMAYMSREHGDAWGVMANIKRSFDPKNILNPGKLVQIN